MTPLIEAPAITNPYVVTPPLSPEAVQFVLLLAVGLFIAGMLLAEKNSLLRIAKVFDTLFSGHRGAEQYF